MVKRVQIVGHGTVAADAFVGKEREVTIDTDRDDARVHDGVTAGGHRVPNKSYIDTQDAAVQADADAAQSTADSALTVANAAIPKSIISANNDVIVGTGAATPAALAMAAGTILARLAAGNIVAASPAQIRTLLALVVGTNVQAWDDDLDDIAAIAPATNDFIVRGATNWEKKTVNQVNAILSAGSGLDADLLNGLTAEQIEDRVIPDGGTVNMIFHEATAPTGWTQVVSINDRVMRVVSGAGGGLGGSWALSGINVTVANHAITIAQMPAHDHVATATMGTEDRDASFAATTKDADSAIDQSVPRTDHVTIGSRGGGATHTHAGSTAVGNSVWRPLYVNVIIASRN